MLFSALLLHTVYGCLPWILVMGAPTQVSPTPRDEPSSTEIQFNTNYRSTTDIVWSCQRMRRRLFLMLWGIAAPEFLSWTNAHSHFLQMGATTPPHFIDVQQLSKQSHEAGRQGLRALLMSSPTEDDIWDKSKGDTLAKAIVALQTTWFLTQILGRIVQRLTITELEVVTLAYAAFNAAMYAFWWNKPLDVQCPILVPFAGVEELHLYDTASRFDTLESLHFAPLGSEGRVVVAPHGSPLAPATNHDLGGQTDVLQPQPQPQTSPNPQSTFSLLSSIFRSVLGALRRPLEIMHHVYIVTGFKRSGENYVFSVFEHRGMSYRTNHRQREPRDPSCVPVFYTYSEAPDIAPSSIAISALAMFLASCFGAIHCIAWTFSSLTEPETLLWRICALLICLSPVMSCITFLAATWYSWTLQVPTYRSLYEFLRLLVIKVLAPFHNKVFIPILLPSYLLARLDAHQTVEWSDFLPHV
ncbi:hypothetical protein BKA70DRAFT_1316077 [Coprinopsis sp. MPI-PUGE-AT-0042]|nr:hypothetical protein BKA70DRAFT_1316077 [Coprinopsis sp. MPI-PUGE-AT-0042]